MGVFVAVAAMLVLVALGFVLAPLWQRSRALAIALAVALPLCAAGLYLLEGAPAALDPANVKPPATVDDAVAQLQRRLKSEPESFETLVVLARSYMATGRFAEARDAYARAVKLDPADVDVPVEYAEALLRTSADRRFPPQAVAMLERAVAAHPNNERALFFLGMHQFQSGQPAQAATTWERLLPLLQPDAAAALRQQVNAARKASGQTPLAEPRPLITVEIDVDGSLAHEVRPGDVLFVFARAVGGAGPPVAAKRVELGTLPLSVGLGDEDSPMPAARLSAQSRVTVQARLSHGGNADPASGDLEADPVEASTTAGSHASLVLNRTRP
jgi:cytochrome c-type biogenesis protein CcmH